MTADRSPKRRGDAAACVRQVLIWLPAAAMGLYLKFFDLRHGGSQMVLLSLGRRMPAHFQPFSWSETASFYRAELLWGMLAVPMLLLAAVSLGGRRLQRTIVAVASLLLIAVMLAQLESLIVLGAFEPWALVLEGLEWGVRKVPQAGGYVKLGRSAWLAMVLGGLTVVLAAGPERLIEKYVVTALLRHWRAALVVFGICCAGIGFAWLPWLPETAEHRYLAAAAVASFYGATLSPEEGQLSKLRPDELGARYRALSCSPSQAHSKYFGAAKGYDVLFFVMETMPSLCVSFDSAMEDLPQMAGLKSAAFVGSAHQTTYPLTVRALFSLMTGMYPPDGRTAALIEENWEHGYEDAGYRTGLYSGSIPRGDMETFRHLGFQQIYGAPENPNSVTRRGHEENWVRAQMRRDDDALAEVEKDINNWIDRDQRYMAIYLPKVSHGPWADITSGGNEKDVIQRGRNLAIHVDGLLGEVLALLRKKGRLERTLIVVTADHGLRTWAETPKGLAMLTDEYAFGVPFLLYAPGVVKQTERISYLTSHVDVQPSVMDLLGISARRDREQGTPIWDERMALRHTYFWANESLGSDGMFADERFHVWNRNWKLAYSGPRMHFSGKDAVPDDSPRERQTTEEMARMDAIRIAWFRAH